MNNTQWTARNIYLYLICLVTLLLVIFAVVESVKSVVELAYPEPVQPYAIKPMVPPDAEAAAIDAAEEARQQEIQQQWAVRRSLLNLVRNITMLVVAGPIYLYHWRKIERMSAQEPEGA